MPGVDPVYLMVQSNNNIIEDGNSMFKVFDLKGSMFGRKVIDSKAYLEGDIHNYSTFCSIKKSGHQVNMENLPRPLKQFLERNTETLLDQDFQKLTTNFKELFHINIRESDRKELLKIILSDVTLLAELNLMDYSILLAIEENRENYSYEFEYEIDILNIN